MAVKEKTESEEMEWSAEEEFHLFLAMIGQKPIGIHKHVHMACICKRLSSALKREVQPETVWAHLHTSFNLDLLEKSEPTEKSLKEQIEFSIPESEFSSLISKKLQEEDQKVAEKLDTGSRCN